MPKDKKKSKQTKKQQTHQKIGQVRHGLASPALLINQPDHESVGIWLEFEIDADCFKQWKTLREHANQEQIGKSNLLTEGGCYNLLSLYYSSLEEDDDAAEFGTDSEYIIEWRGPGGHLNIQLSYDNLPDLFSDIPLLNKILPKAIHVSMISLLKDYFLVEKDTYNESQVSLGEKKITLINELVSKNISSKQCTSQKIKEYLTDSNSLCIYTEPFNQHKNLLVVRDCDLTPENGWSSIYYNSISNELLADIPLEI